MADDDLIEAEGNIAFGNTSMFGDADEAPEDEGFGSVVVDDESEGDLIAGYSSVKDFGRTPKFDFSTGQFVKRGNSNEIVMVDGHEAFAQWCMNVLHTERLSALIYSADIGVEFEDIVRGGRDATASAARLLPRIEEALAVHDRFKRVEDFSYTVEGDLVVVSMRVITTDGAVDVQGALA